MNASQSKPSHASILYWYLWKRVDEVYVFCDIGQRVVHVAA